MAVLFYVLTYKPCTVRGVCVTVLYRILHSWLLCFVGYRHQIESYNKSSRSHFLFYVLQQYYAQKKCTFSMLYQYVSFHDLNVRGASVPAALEVRALAMLLLPIAGNYKYGAG